jgi:FkbH-like protein
VSHGLSTPAASGEAAAARLARAAAVALEASTDPERRLAGLAALDPVAAIRWLRDTGLEAAELVAADRLRASFGTAIRLIAAGVPGDDLQELVVGAVEATGVFPSDELVHFFERIGPEKLSPVAEPLLDRILEKEPGHPALLRMLGAVAAARRDAPRAHALFGRLAAADPSATTLAYVRKARAVLEAEPAPAARVALLSSYTIDPIVPFLDYECRALGLAPEIYLAPFNSWAREVVDTESGLHRFQPDIAFLAVGIDDLVPGLVGSPDPEELERAGEDTVRTVTETASRFVSAMGKPMVVHGFHSAFRGPMGTLEGRLGPSRAEWLAGLNARLAGALRDLPSCYLLDVQDVILREGGGADKPNLRHLAAMRLAPEALAPVARAYARYIAPQKGLARKCVVLDLDNTLWGGVVGEDGPGGIRLGHQAPGSEYVEFQEYLATLSTRGFLLAINSKNNPDDALEVIRGHEAMVLREAAFSAIRINWRPKPENMAALAEELNIGLDALIFVDDNPDERELMRQLVPQVLTVELPRDPSRWRGVLEQLPQLQTLAVTQEDRSRVSQYAANRQREQVRVSAASLEQYLASLAIRVEIGPVTDAMLPRLAQLYQRTNQFNVTTRRYDAGDLRRFMGDPGRKLYAVKAGDRFGDHGLVATALVRREDERWTIDSFLMSCRVIGYGVETALLAQLSADVLRTGATRLGGEFIPTKKNAPAKDVYIRHGFIAEGTDGGVEQWTLDLSTNPIAIPPWIQAAPHGT